MTEAEFINDIKKVNSKRKHKIKNSFGVYDAYKYYRKNKPKDRKYIITESQYFSIIRTINNKLKDLLTANHDIVFPERLGKLQIIKKTPVVYKENNNIKNTYPIDWNTTLKLWYEDKESYVNKKIVKTVTQNVYKVIYNKSQANYNNKSFFDFKLNRDIKVKLKHNIQEGIIKDAFI